MINISVINRHTRVCQLTTHMYAIALFGLSMIFSIDIDARSNPGWGNAALVCESPRIGNDSPDINFGGKKNSIETGYYHIGRIPDPANRFLAVENANTVRMLSSETHEPTRWLVTGVGADLYQISICHNGHPRCLTLSDDRKMQLGECTYDAYGNQAWWNVGILFGPGKGGWELGSDGASHMECLTENPDTGIPYLAPCDTSGKPQFTWRVEAANNKQVNSSSAVEMQQTNSHRILSTFPAGVKPFTYQCESGQIVKSLYDSKADQMQVLYRGQLLTLDPVISGSGAKFGGENVPWGWWTKGEEGIIFTYLPDGNDGEFIERCKELEAVQKTAISSVQDPEPVIDPNREWSANGGLEKIVLTDCRNCGDDIGMTVACQGAENPALVSLNWAAIENSPPAASLMIEVDGQTFERKAFTVYNGMLGQVPQFHLYRDDPLIAAFKKGNVAKVTFGDLTTYIGLRGSKSAFDIFYAHCGWNQPLQNTTQVSQQQDSIKDANETGSDHSDGAIWYRSEYFDDKKNRSVSHLIFGIPETDAVAFDARCDRGASTAEIDLFLDTSNLTVGAPYYVRLQTSSFDHTFKGQVFSENSEYSGVRLTISGSDPFWVALAGGKTLYIGPQSGNALELNHSTSMTEVKTWLDHCSN